MSTEFRLDWMGLWLMLFSLLVIWSFYRLHRDDRINFNLFDLVMENGRLSKIAVCFMAAFMLTSWMMVYLTLANKMTEGYFGLYGSLWVSALVTRVIFGKHEPTNQGAEIKP